VAQPEIFSGWRKCGRGKRKRRKGDVDDVEGYRMGWGQCRPPPFTRHPLFELLVTVRPREGKGTAANPTYPKSKILYKSWVEFINSAD